MQSALAESLRLRRLLETRGYVPHPKQLELHQDKHRYKVIRCGRRFGKSVFAVNHIIEQATYKPGDYWFVAPTYRQAKEIAWRLFEAYVPRELIKKKNETELSIDLVNGSRIALKGADNPDSLRGVGLNGVVLDEYAFTQSYAWTVISPILQDKRGWAIFISTPNGYNHFYDLSNTEQGDNDYKSFHFTSYDNPYLDPEELDKERARMSVERFEQEYMAEFTRKSGAVWTKFRRSIHIVPRRGFDAALTHTCSIDFGFAIGHPTSFSVHEWNNQGEVYTGDGFIQDGLNVDQIDNLMRSKTTGLTIRAVYYDSARPDLAQQLSDKGWPMLPANKDVELGIAKVDEFMSVNPLTARPLWTMSEHLTEQVQQIEGYEWQEVRGEDGIYKQVPKKQNDDFCDELRYNLNTHTKQAKKHRKIVGWTGGDPVTGFGRKPIYGGGDMLP